MFAKLTEKYAEANPHLKVVALQLRWPAALAFLYGLYDWYSVGKGFQIAAFLKVTLPALFLIMWIVGLYERAKKKNTDQDAFNGINSGIQSLTTLVEDLLKSGHASATVTATPSGVSTFSHTLMREAEKVFQGGHKLAALLQAGVAFEQAVRAFALRKGLAEAERMPLLNILQKIDFLLPEGWRGEMHMLRKIRNQLAHASELELIDIGNADMILQTYALAITALDGRPNA